MSVEAPRLRVARRRIGSWAPLRGAASWMPVLVPRAVLASRLIVVLAGIAGTRLADPRGEIGEPQGARGLGAVGKLLGASVDRFDATYYLSIATHGYGAPARGHVAFLPAYPALIRVLSLFVVSPVIAGVLISLGSFVVALVLLHRLTAHELGDRAADATVLLLCFAPLSFYFSAVYTESLFLALSVGSIYAARTGRWRTACALVAVAALSRPTGILLCLPLLVIWRRERAPLRQLAWLGLAPAAFAGWMAVLAVMHYGALGEFHAEHTLWYRSTVFPLTGLIAALYCMVRGGAEVLAGGTVYHPSIRGVFTVRFNDFILGGMLCATLVGIEACRRRMAPEYWLYAAVVVVLLLSQPAEGEPLWCFDRFALTIFPVWMAAGGFLARRPRLLIGACVLGAAALAFYTMQFASGAFVA